MALVTGINAAGVPGTFNSAPTIGIDWRTVLADEARRWGDVLRWRVAATTEPTNPMMTLPPPTPWIVGSEYVPGGFGGSTMLIAVAAIAVLLILRK